MEICRLAPEDDRRAAGRGCEERWKWACRKIIPRDYLDSIPEGRFNEGGSLFCL